MAETPDGTTDALLAIARAIQQLAASTGRIADVLDKTERATRPQAPTAPAGRSATSELVAEPADQARWRFPNHGSGVEGQ
jgi:hypothetical protein